MSQEVNLAPRLSYSNVLVSSENKLVYLLLEISPSGQTSFAEAALNMALVLDKSGSMYAAEKIDYVKQAVQYVVDQLRPEDLVSIIAFADRARVMIPSQQIFDKGGVKRMIQRIDDVDVGGGTEMNRGIRAAIDEVEKHLAPDKVNHVVLLTDGLTLHEDECIDRARGGTSRGLSFSTMGVGSDFNEKLLIRIAELSGGKSYYIDDPRDIPQIFAQELRGVQSVVVQNIQLKLKVSKDIQVRRVFKVKPLINDMGAPALSDRTMTVKLSDLQKNEPQSILCELVLPSRPSGTFRIAQVQVAYDILSQRRAGDTVSADVVVNYTSDAALAGMVDGEVMNIVDLVSVFKQQTKALELVQSGETGKATQLLRSAATTLLDRGQSDLANTFKEEAARLEKGGTASAAGTKKLEYGTRKLTQLLDETMIQNPKP
ncbi:MAG: VWA domain-containing protein [Armatimonadetes bacterium]|nr:VWA domain-containing protein [Armatimonadota bacterium]